MGERSRVVAEGEMALLSVLRTPVPRALWALLGLRALSVRLTLQERLAPGLEARVGQRVASAARAQEMHRARLRKNIGGGVLGARGSPAPEGVAAPCKERPTSALEGLIASCANFAGNASSVSRCGAARSLSPRSHCHGSEIRSERDEGSIVCGMVAG